MTTLVELAPDLWRARGADLRMPGGVYMPLAAAVLRLPDRSLAVYSPIAFDPAQLAAISALGEVAHVIAPSLLHHRFVSAALAQWPRATLHAPPGLAAKRPDLSPRSLADPDPALHDALEIEVVAGAPSLGETTLFHRPSRSMLCADLVFNIQEPANLRTRAVLAMMGVGGRRLAQSRAWRIAVKDRTAARRSLDRILEWPIARIAPSHGDPAAITSGELAAQLTRSYRGRPARLLVAAPDLP